MSNPPREVHAFIEFPVNFESETAFVSYSGEESCVSFLRHDPPMIDLLMSSRNSSEAEPEELSDDTRAAYDTFSKAGELLSKPRSLDVEAFERTLEDASIQESELNPMLRVSLAALRILSDDYGDDSRFVFWEVEP